MGNRRRAIIISPWGYPPQWRKAIYRFKFDRKGLNMPELSCRACNSTLALASSLIKSNLVEIEKIIVIGLDSVMKPKEDRVIIEMKLKSGFMK